MRRGEAHGLGKRMGQQGGQEAGRGLFGLLSLAFGLLSHAAGRKDNGEVYPKTAKEPQANRLVASAVMDKCCFCGICQQVCPQGAITQGQVLHIRLDRCTGCGQCVLHCPEDALILRKANT
jgi:ferredoxin